MTQISHSDQAIQFLTYGKTGDDPEIVEEIWNECGPCDGQQDAAELAELEREFSNTADKLFGQGKYTHIAADPSNDDPLGYMAQDNHGVVLWAEIVK